MSDEKEQKVSKPTVRSLVFKLTEKEFAEKGKRAAEINQKIRNLNAEFDDIKKRFKADLAQEELELAAVLTVIREGEEPRKVECQAVYDFKRFAVDYVYQGEVKDSRPMEDHERQMEIPEANKVVPMKTGKDAAFKDD